MNQGVPASGVLKNILRPRLDARASLGEAPSADRILDVASKLHGDQIVMRPHGRGGANRLLLRSVVERRNP